VSEPRLSTEKGLTEEQEDRIARILADHFIVQQFPMPMSNADYRRKLGNLASQLKGVTVEGLHQYLLTALPTQLGRMFGWSECGLSGSNQTWETDRE
jgi:hypothetical protein